MSGVATATTTEEITPAVCPIDAATTDTGSDAVPAIPAIRWNARDVTETKLAVRQLH